MAAKKMTITLPEEHAAQFVKRVPSRERSRYVVDALSRKLADRERQLIRACQAANRDADVARIEREFDALGDEIQEPWTDVPSR